MPTTAKKLSNVIHLPITCKTCHVREHGICGHLADQQLELLEKYSVKSTKKTHESIARQGEKITHHTNVLEGVVKLTKSLPDGRQQIVGLQFPSDFLGSPFDTKHRFNVAAAGDVKICSFPKTLINEFVEKSADLEHKMHQQTLVQLNEAREMMLTLGRKTAPEKIASFIYMLAAHLVHDFENRTSNLTFELPLTRHDIADYLGLTTETVSRNMTKLRKDSVIKVENHRFFTIPDKKRLKFRAEG